jgi:cytochrome c
MSSRQDGCVHRSKRRHGALPVIAPIAQRVAASLLCALCLASGPAYAQAEPVALIDAHRCMFCHTVDAPFLAPSFQQIAQRYRNVPDAGTMLEQKLRMGGQAHWGDMAMPLPAERGGSISAQDAHALVQWVLAQ